MLKICYYQFQMINTSSPQEVAPSNTAEHLAERKAKLAEYVNDQLDTYAQKINPLLELRHDLFNVNGTEYTSELSIPEQLYEDPTYNVEFIGHDMGLRNGNALDYHQTTEKYDRGLSEEHAERDEVYRKAILEVAQDLGFISKYAGEASNPIDTNIGILDSEFELVPEKVSAIVINGAAGMSNVKRVRDAIRNIEAGLIDTDRIVITAGTRPVNDAEKGRMKPPYRAGDSEFESMKLAVTDLTGVEFSGDVTEIPVEYGDQLTEKVETVVVAIGDRLITIDVAEAPFDNTRTMDDGRPAQRINTEEAFLAALPLLEGIEGAVVMESHDTWTPWQDLIGHKVFGIQDGRTVYPAGPFNAERVHVVEENGEKTIDIASPQDVVDEIVKTYRQLVQMSIELSD